MWIFTAWLFCTTVACLATSFAAYTLEKTIQPGQKPSEIYVIPGAIGFFAGLGFILMLVFSCLWQLFSLVL